MCRLDIVFNPVHSTQCGRRKVRIDNAAIRSAPIETESNRIKGGTRIRHERTASTKGRAKRPSEVAKGGLTKYENRPQLDGCVRLAGAVSVSRVDLPSPERFTQESMLGLVEREVVNHGQPEEMWKVNSTVPLFTSPSIERVLRDGESGTASEV